MHPNKSTKYIFQSLLTVTQISVVFILYNSMVIRGYVYICVLTVNLY